MPMLTVEIPEGALTPDAEDALMSTLTDVLLTWEGADPTNPVVRQIAWVFLSRPAAVYVAGERSELPRYRITAAVPEGQFDDERRAGIVHAVTEAVLDAEEGRHPRDPMRVWVFATEIPDGTWGGAGRIARLADIAGLAMGDAEEGRRYAEQRLAQRRGALAPATA